MPGRLAYARASLRRMFTQPPEDLRSSSLRQASWRTVRSTEIIAAMVIASLQGRDGQQAEAAVPSPASPGSVPGFGREEVIEHEPRAPSTSGPAISRARPQI